MACVQLYVSLGARYENFIMFDKDGVLHQDRTDLGPIKEKFAVSKPDWTLTEALKDADVFVGLSVGNVVTGDMIKNMAAKPIVFAMANPDPEITYEAAIAVRNDIIMATGRSDYPNQVNNVLGFPYIFRGALDVRARSITPNMVIAAARAIADLVPPERLSAQCRRNTRRPGRHGERPALCGKQVRHRRIRRPLLHQSGWRRRAVHPL